MKSKLAFLFLFIAQGCAHFDGKTEAAYRPDLGHGHMYSFKLNRK